MLGYALNSIFFLIYVYLQIITFIRMLLDYANKDDEYFLILSISCECFECCHCICACFSLCFLCGALDFSNRKDLKKHADLEYSALLDRRNIDSWLKKFQSDPSWFWDKYCYSIENYILIMIWLSFQFNERILMEKGEKW